MTARLVTLLAGAGCFAGAFALAPPRAQDLEAPVHWLVRPAVLPFAWRDLERARTTGDADEVFSLAHRVLQLLPGWTDGHIVFAYRFATQGDVVLRSPAERAAAAWQRLQIALAWLESVRATAGRREVQVLEAMAMLPEVAVLQEPGLAAQLPAGGAAGLADGYLAQAERLAEGPYVRENRTFLTPRVAAGLLASGDRSAAVAVLETGISRSVDVRDRALATEWAHRLGEIVRHLRGEVVDLTPVRADSRMSPLLPYLR